MNSTRIHIGYRPTDSPWGGANNFIRALRAELLRAGRYVLTTSMTVDCDILFMNQLSIAPGVQSTFNRVRAFRAGRSTVFDRIRGRRPAKAASLVVRAVNLNRHAFRQGLRNVLVGRERDRQALRLVNFADMVIFQSRYQQRFFEDHGYVGKRHLIIHNGADPAFWSEVVPARPPGGVLRVASSTASARNTKRHDLIAELSMVADVEVVHFGNWPADVPSQRVQRCGMVSKERMAELYASCDYFFHPAVKDPCPNAIFEAVCAGLPVIYNAGPGSSSEIVGENGFALDEANLGGTVSRARAIVAELRARVLQTRAYYTAQRAASQYCAAFDTVASEL